MTAQFTRVRRPRQSTNPPSPAANQHAAQRTPASMLGNQLMQALQPKLAVNAPNDTYEQEADRLASQATQMTTPSAQAAENGRDEKKRADAVQTKSLASQVTPLSATAQREAVSPKEDEESLTQASAVQRAEKSEEKKKEPPKQESGKREMKQDDEKRVRPPRGGAPEVDDKKKKDKDEAQANGAKTVQRAPKEEEKKKPETTKKEGKKKEDEKAVQKKDNAAGSPMPEQTEAELARQSQGGRPLDAATRSSFEPAFGADFSGVRIHDDAEAARLSNQLNARAFTHGEHIFFGAGNYQPGDAPGRQLLAHELTHTLQQGAARPAATQRASRGAQHNANLPSSPRRIGRTMVQRADGDTSEGLNALDDANDTEAQTVPEYTTSGRGDARFEPLFAAIREVGPSLPTSTGHYFPAGAEDGLLFDKVQAPAFKLSMPGVTTYTARYGTNYGQFARFRDYGRRAPNQRAIWLREVTDSGIRDKMNAKLRQNVGGSDTAFAEARQKPIRLVRVPVQGGGRGSGGGRSEILLFGTENDVVSLLKAPNWGRSRGSATAPAKQMQVDHVVELQIGNWGAHNRANTIENMALLDRFPNAASGDFIRQYISGRVRRLIEHVYAQQAEQMAATQEPARPTSRRGRREPATPRTELDAAVDAVKRRFHIEFDAVEPASGRGAPTVTDQDYWTRREIQDGLHLNNAQITSHDSLADVLGSRSEVFVFNRRTGGKHKSFRWPGSYVLPEEENWLAPFKISQKAFPGTTGDVNQRDNFGALTVVLQEPRFSGQDQSTRLSIEFPLELERIYSARYAGYINVNRAKGLLNRNAERLGVELPPLSPVTFDEFDILDTGVYLRGRIMPNVPILRGTEIDFELDRGDLRVSKTFTANDVSVPAPLRIDAASLTISAGTRSGVQVAGRADFGIDRVGTGFLEARTRLVGRRPQFSMAGGFDFDSQLFDPAHIEMRYADGQFSGEGTIGIPRGKVRGIRSARLRMSYAENRFSADGVVQPEVPGVREGTLSLVYSEQEGLVISGSLQLEENPALRSGSIEARIERKPDGSYKVHAAGTAEPKIPGVSSRIAVTYDDGAFDAEVTAAYARGMINGSLRVAATNRAVNQESGQPEGEPTENITVYGGGQVTIRFSPWLQGTAGLRLLPNGEIEVTGSIGLPSTVNIFDARRFDRNIFRVNIDIPIVGVSVLGQRIGIFATIGGGLDLTAGIGPGQLRDLSLTVTYNPAHEEETHIVGHGELFIPADAGLRLFIRGGLGAGIPIVSATAGVEVGGQLGLEGAARAAVDVDWTPQQGIVLDALGEIYVEPRLKLDVSAYVEVEADLLLKTVELYSNRWNLANYEIGSNLRFGVRFPIHYAETEPFDISIDDLEFQIPEIDAESILSSILSD
jgi:hypothetical protein